MDFGGQIQHESCNGKADHNLNKRVQRRFFRFINYKFGVPRDDINYEHLTAKLNLCGLSDRREMMDLVTLYKIIDNMYDFSDLAHLIKYPNPSTSTTQALTFYEKILRNKHFTTDPKGRVDIRLGKEGIAAEPSITVPDLLKRTAAAYPDQVALATKNADGSWDTLTYKQYKEQVRICAKAFVRLGLERYHAVGILGFNSLPWLVADLAAIHAGGLATGIYTTNNPEACFHILHGSHAQIVLVEDSKQLEKILAIWDRLPHLKVVVQWDGKIKEKRSNLISWEELMDIGRKESDKILDEIITTLEPNECCTLVYTSGTVGQPKGVMLSHDNFVWNVSVVNVILKINQTEGRIVSYLPLSHIAAQIFDIYLPIFAALTVYFADHDALKGSLFKTFLEVKPTRFLGVPRVWEKLYEKISAAEVTQGFVKGLLLNWARSKSLIHHMNATERKDRTSLGYALAHKYVLKKVKALLGLEEVVSFITGAAPLSAEVKMFFMSLDMPLVEVYGMSECSGAQCMTTSDFHEFNSAGRTLPGMETKIHNPHPETGEGELCIRGRHVFMGYLNDVAKTEETVDEEGWLHTGDISKTDAAGRIYITGRLKEIIITSGGENVAPLLIENEIKKQLPCISQAVVIGDKRKFLSVLLTFKTEVDPESGMPLDALTSDSIAWLKNIESDVKSVPEILKASNNVIHKAIEDGIKRANEHAISNAQKVQKFAILPKDLSVATEELGPTMKLKRNMVTAKYADIIESMYV